VTNTSSDTLPTGLNPVPAIFDGTLTVTMACEDSTCAVELPGTLSFVPVGVNGCVDSLAEVNSCSASGANQVLIDVTNLTLPPGSFLNVAVIRVQADTPVLPPEDGEFAMRAASGPNDLEACDSLDPGICATGGAVGSAPLFFPEICGDGILNPDLGETCDPPGSTPDPVFPENLCRDTCTYCGDGIVNNGEDCDFNDPNAPPGCRENCTLAECGDGILDPDLGETCDPPGSTPDPAFPENLCGPNCNYCGDGIQNNGEECDFNDPNAPANCRTDCTLAFCGDEILDPGETCDPPGSIPDMGFPDNVCRESCTYCGDGEVNNGEECDFNDPNAPPECQTDCTIQEGEGCIFRTPGFWCTHDEVADLFLPVDSCGLTVDNSEPETPVSSTEDLQVGNDFKAADTSPQQLQLIRQCTAAALNFAASMAADGSCDNVLLSNGMTAGEAIESCCNDLCTSGASGTEISESGCIELIDEFNNTEPDTLTCETNPDLYPFCPSLGFNGFNATPEECSAAKNNGFVNPGRNLGPR
jgi:hypothetical protein